MRLQSRTKHVHPFERNDNRKLVGELGRTVYEGVDGPNSDLKAKLGVRSSLLHLVTVACCQSLSGWTPSLLQSSCSHSGISPSSMSTSSRSARSARCTCARARLTASFCSALLIPILGKVGVVAVVGVRDGNGEGASVILLARGVGVRGGNVIKSSSCLTSRNDCRRMSLLPWLLSGRYLSVCLGTGGGFIGPRNGDPYLEVVELLVVDDRAAHDLEPREVLLVGGLALLRHCEDVTEGVGVLVVEPCERKLGSP